MRDRRDPAEHVLDELDRQGDRDEQIEVLRGALLAEWIRAYRDAGLRAGEAIEDRRGSSGP